MLFRKLANIICIAALGFSCSAFPQTYPIKPIRLVVPFPPGGTSDILARLLGNRLSDILGRSFIIDNRPGAGGTIGTNLVAHASPDGYTLLLFHVSLAVDASLYSKLPYDTLRDIAPISRLCATPSLVTVNPSLPIRSIKDLIAAAKTSPGRINYSSGGIGTASHLGPALLETVANVKFSHIAYKGGAPAVVAVISGEVQLMIGVVPDVLPYVAAGKLRALAVTATKRLEALQELPTVAEAGVPGYDYETWYGIFAPGGTPRALLVRLNSAANNALRRADFQKDLKAQGLEPGGSSVEEFTMMMAMKLQNEQSNKRWWCQGKLISIVKQT